MASTRELWILLRARDEASRVVSSFSKNVRAAALAAQAAQKSAEAAAIRQQAQMLKTNGVTATQIRSINESVVALERQARAQTLAASKAREHRAEQLKAIEGQVRSYNVHAANLERQARAYTLAAAAGEEHRENLIRVTGATDEQVVALDKHISAIRKRAATLNAEAAVARGASASLIAQLQKEQTGLDGSIRSYERRAAVLRAQASEMRNQAARLKINLDDQVRALTNQAAALDKQANGLRRAANAAREADIQHRKLITTMGKVSEASTVMAFTMGAIGVGGLVGLKQAIDTTVEYDRQVRATATQVDGFKGNLEEIGDIGRRVANDIAVPFETIQPALFDIFSSMEVNMKDAERLLRAFSKAAVAGQVEIQDVSRATIGLLNAFNRPAKDVTKILDMQFQLIQEGIGTYEEWNQRIGLVTPSAVRAGQSIEMMMAALAASTRMGISAARSGTAVARAMDAMSHPAAVKNMEQLGIKVRDARGNFLPMNEVLRDFRTVLNKMPMKDRLEAILNVFKGAGGTIEARRFLQNILLGKNGLELFDATLGEVQGSAGSMEKAYGIMADSTAGKTELLRNKWQLLKEAIGQALLPSFNDLIDKLSQVLDWFNKLPQSTKGAIGQFILWGSIISIVLAGMFAFMAAAAVFVAAIGTIGIAAGVTIGILAALPVVLFAIGAAFIYAYNNSATFRDMVKGLGDTIKELWGIVSDTASSIKESFDTHVLPPLKRVKDTLEQDVLPPLRKFADMVKNEIIPKVEEASRIIKDLADGALKRVGEIIDDIVVPALEKMADWWDKNGEKLRPIIMIVGQVVKWFLILAAIITGILVMAFIGPLVAAVAVVVGAFQLLSMAALWIINGWKQVIEWTQQLWARLQEFAAAAGGFFQELGMQVQTAVQGIITWFQQLPGQIMGFLQSLPGMLAGLFMSAIMGAAYAIGYGVGLIYLYFTQVVPNVMGFLGSLPGRLRAVFLVALANAANIASQILNRTVQILSQLPGRARAAILRIAANVAQVYGDARAAALRLIADLVNGSVRTAQSLPGRIGQALADVRAAVLRAFAGASGWLVSAGEDIIRGVISGIGRMIGGGVAAARDAAHRMVRGFKDAIKVGSPSKVFMQLGEFSMQGYAIGLAKEARIAAKEVKNQTGKILTSVPDSTMPMPNRRSHTEATTETSREFNQQIVIHTQQIDPRRHAAELGWELEGRLR